MEKLIDFRMEWQFRVLPAAVQRWVRAHFQGLARRRRRPFFRPRTLLMLHVLSQEKVPSWPDAANDLPPPVVRWLESELRQSLGGLCVVPVVTYNPTNREAKRMRSTFERLSAKAAKNLRAQGVSEKDFERTVSEAVSEVRARRARARTAARARWKRQ